MNQSLKVTNLENEFIDSTSNCRLEISNEIQIDSTKNESDCLINSEIHIKTEPQEDECEFVVVAGTSYEMYPNCDEKIETDESIVKLEYDNLKTEIMEDPLNVSGENTEEDIFFDKHLLDTEKHCDLHSSGSNNQVETPTTYLYLIREKMEEAVSVEEEQLESKISNNQNQLHSKNKQIHRKKHICHTCNKLFVKKSHLDVHLRIHTGERPFTCHICEKSFIDKRTMKKHLFTHTDEKTHECDICKKCFKYKSYLNKHKLMHTAKGYSCNECNKSFTFKQHLIDHARTHTGDKPYVCDFCYKAFSIQSNLNRHRRLHT